MSVDEPLGEDLVLSDAHCHLDLFPDPRALARSIEARRIHTIAVTNAPSVFEHTRRLAEGYVFVHPALGLHPELVPTHGHELPRMTALISEVRFVGEIGLDYTTSDEGARARQRRVFGEILDKCTVTGDKVITVHSRRAAGDVIAAVGRGYSGKVILHWFSGTKGELERAVSYGLFFSVNPSMLATAKGRDLVSRMPQDRVLLESDGPFVRERGRMASPLSLAATVSGLATHWRVTPRRASEIVAANFERITG